MPRSTPHPTDNHAGKKLRMRRKMLGMSQTKLADALGLTFQQVQKYEKGANRMGASRLQQISRILQVPVEFFFDGVSHQEEQNGPQSDAPSVQYVSDYLASADGLQLTRAFTQISDVGVRRSIVRLVERIAAPEDDSD
jgi:transcriptional regulator with XRE-family HTH domain